MPSCQKCWSDAFTRSKLTYKSQAECYHELIEERNKDNPCSLKEQAGEFWDDKLKKDTRKVL